MKTRALKGWTNGNPVELTSCERKTVVTVCQAKQRGLCTGNGGKCADMRPNCLDAELRMVGKSLFGRGYKVNDLTPEDEKEIDRQLRAGYAKCHPVKITIRELPAPKVRKKVKP